MTAYHPSDQVVVPLQSVDVLIGHLDERIVGRNEYGEGAISAQERLHSDEVNDIAEHGKVLIVADGLEYIVRVITEF